MYLYCNVNVSKSNLVLMKTNWISIILKFRHKKLTMITFKIFHQVTNGNIEMSTCPSSFDSEDELENPLNQFSRSLVRGKYACKLQDMLYQQTLQNSSFCDVTLHIDNSVSIFWWTFWPWSIQISIHTTKFYVFSYLQVNQILNCIC